MEGPHPGLGERVRRAALLGTLAALVTAPVSSGQLFAFPDASHGWVATTRGIVGTQDGGRHWKLEWRGGAYDLVSFGALHAWAVANPGGRNSRVLRTTDGAHWRVVSRQHLGPFAFPTASRGFALGKHGLLGTRDGGLHWRTLRSPSRRLSALCFPTPRLGWVAHWSTVWRTADGGHHWQRSLTAHRGRWGIGTELSCRGSSVWAVFTGGAGAGSEWYDVFRSLDDGRSWKPVLANKDSTYPHLPSISSYTPSISVTGPRSAVAIGECGACSPPETVTVARTHDGGRHWRLLHPFHRWLSLEGISFPSASTGWLAGSAKRFDYIFRTTDGGRHWRLQAHFLE